MSIPVITEDEIARNKSRLRKKRAAGPDGTTAEDIEAMDNYSLAQQMNRMIQQKDTVLVHGHVLPILKPAKDSMQPAS